QRLTVDLDTGTGSRSTQSAIVIHLAVFRSITLIVPPLNWSNRAARTLHTEKTRKNLTSAFFSDKLLSVREFLYVSRIVRYFISSRESGFSKDAEF
ncbi:MAG TPA: hypothetical protein VJ417_06755, partial [Candidatus Glassbacteria bacterium]|nr:hypothetical protein [Candidatus Glassbacteria bacterium]